MSWLISVVSCLRYRNKRRRCRERLLALRLSLQPCIRLSDGSAVLPVPGIPCSGDRGSGKRLIALALRRSNVAISGGYNRRRRERLLALRLIDIAVDGRRNRWSSEWTRTCWRCSIVPGIRRRIRNAGRSVVTGGKWHSIGCIEHSIALLSKGKKLVWLDAGR